MGRKTKRNDLARAEEKGLKVTYRIRVLDPDRPGAEDLRRRQLKAIATIICRSASKRQRGAGDSEG